MKREAIWPGQVFAAEHFDAFSKSFVSHMFVCVYVDKLTSTSSEFANITGLLITSKVRMQNVVEIDKDKNTFLSKQSYCIVNSNYTFGNVNQVKLVGQLDAETFKNIISARNGYVQQELYQCMTSLVNMTRYQTKEKLK